MANWSLPTIADLYSNIIAYLGNRLNDAALWFDSGLTSPTNQPTGAKRWNSSSNKFEKWSGSSWADLATTYSISISGNAATATTAASCSGNAATATTAASCSGNAATATTAASCSGNAATATAAAGLSGTPVLGYSANGQSIAYTAQGGPMVYNNNSGASMISFQRQGTYAVNFGIDTDNVLRVGGWSMGAVSYPILHHGNVKTIAGYQLYGVGDLSVLNIGAKPIAAGFGGVGTPYAKSGDTDYTPGSLYSLTVNGMAGSWRCTGRINVTSFTGHSFEYIHIFERES